MKFMTTLLTSVVLLVSYSTALFAAGTQAKLDVDIDWPKEMYFHKPLQGLATQALSSVGASGSTVASSAEKDRKDKTSDVQQVKDHGIDFKKLVADSFVNEMKKKGVYDETSSNSLKLKVVMYGYSHKGGFNINMVPMLKVKAKLFDQSGKRIWKGTGGVSVFGKAIAKADYYELLKSKETAQSMFVVAAEKVAEKALKKYK